MHVRTGFLRPRGLALVFLSLVLFAGPGAAWSEDIDPGWLAVKKWGIKMALTQILSKQGLLEEGSDCRFDYSLALDHVSEVTGLFGAAGQEGLWQGSLASQETVNDILDIIGSGRPECALGNVQFNAICEGPGSEDNVSFSINPAAGTYTIAFPHTGIDCSVQYISWGGSYTQNMPSEINDVYLIDFPSMLDEVLVRNPDHAPVTTLEFPLPGGAPAVIRGETTFQHGSYSAVPITWSWELTPDPPGTDDEPGLGCPDGKCKANGGASGPGSGYGVPTWTVNMENLNVFVTDTPLWYRSPIGPPVEFTVSYNSQAGNAHFEPVGRKWQLNYESYVHHDLITGNVTVYMPDGRRDVFTPNGGGGFNPPYRVYNKLQKISDDRYLLSFPDGTIYDYRVPMNGFFTPLLTEIRDPHGNTLRLGWKATIGATIDGRPVFRALLQSITDAMNRITSITYNETDRITEVRDPFMRTAAFEYDTFGNLTAITDMGGYKTTFTYSLVGNIMQTMNQGINQWEFQINDKEVTVRNNLGTEQFALTSDLGGGYDAPGGQQGAGYSYSHIAADSGRRKEIASFKTPEGVDFRYTYDAKGNILTDTHRVTEESVTTDKTATFTYNSMGKLTSVRDARGTKTDLAYAQNGVDLLRLEDGLGAVTATYNETHDITSLTDRLGNTRTFTYNDYGQPIQATDSMGATLFEYNDFHQLARIRRDNIVIGAYEYDDIGRVSSHTDSSGFKRVFLYNNLDNLLSVTYPDGTVTTFTYSSNAPHLLASMTEPGGRVTTFSHNAYKQLTEIVNPEGGRTRFQYNAGGHMVKLTDPNGNATLFEYDRDGRLVKKTFADGSFVSWRYESGRLKRFTNARGITTDYTYDDNGNVLAIRYGDNTPGVTITYDGYNRATAIADGAGTVRHTFDANSRLIAVDGPWDNDTISLGYDAHGNRTSLAVEKGTTATYGYDALDRLRTVAGGGAAYAYTYRGGAMLPVELTHPGGITTEYAYDGMNRLVRLTNRGAAGIVRENGYVFDSVGRPVRETVTGGPSPRFDFRGETTYACNNLNQVMAAGATQFAYDADGNMTTGVTGAGYLFTATYDAENRLATIEYTDGAGDRHKREYVYRADGFVAVEKHFTNAVPTVEKRFVRHGGRVLQERDGAGVVVREYLWGGGLPGGAGGLLALRQAGKTYSYLHDARGNVTAVCDDTGAVVAAYSYDPFGVPLAAAGTLQQPVRYSTKPYDEGTGLYYYGYRFYSPRLGRWLSRDPMTEKAGANLYAFVGANPISSFDPLGNEGADISWMRPEHQAQYRAMMAEQQAARAAQEGGVVDTINKYVGGAFKWIGDKIKEHPEATKTVVDTVVDKTMEANEYTKFGKENYDRMKKGFEIAEDVGEIQRAIKDPDPASGLTMLKKVVKYTCGRIPGVGSAVEKVLTTGIETVETAPGGVQASQRQHEYGTINKNAAAQMPAAMKD